MSVREVLVHCGGVGVRRALIEHTSRAEVDRALRRGDLLVDGRGRYALPDADPALRAANRVAGLTSHLSAARLHGWELKQESRLPHVTVAKPRGLRRDQRRHLVAHRAELTPGDRDPGPAPLTSPVRTLTDCLRTLDFVDALAVADSALRHRALTTTQLVEVCDGLAGPGGARARRVAHEADARSANPFESALRAHAVVAGLDTVPQVMIGAEAPIGRPDLVDLPRRLVLEADSFTWHGSRAALRRDAERYNQMTLAGFTVLRFTWEEVMHCPEHVRTTLRVARARADAGSRSARRRISPVSSDADRRPR